jgi:integrase
VTEFAKRFLEWSEVHNKPSSVYAKRGILKDHLLPAFGEMRIGEVDLAAVESYKAAKLRAGLKAKTLRNQLTVFSKLLNLAVEFGIVKYVPRVKGLRVEEPEFGFLDFEEADRVIAAAQPEWRAFIVTELRTGFESANCSR